jgi:signal transduction histidine kinase/AmiR/NasT family two-component response regulator
MTLDPATLGFAFVMFACVLGVLLLISFALNRKLLSLGWWGGAFCLGALGLIFVSPRSVPPPPAMLLWANAAIALAYAALYTGCRVFNGRSPRPALLLAGALVWIAVHPIVAHSFATRLTVISFIICGYLTLGAWELWRHSRLRLTSQALAAGLLLAGAAFHGLRIVLVLWPTSVPWLDAVAQRWSAEMALVLFMYVPALAFLLLSMAKEQVEDEHRQVALALESAKRDAEAARVAAEAASEAKSEFLASMSHEIRTPLNGILGYTDILLADPALTPDQGRGLQRIQSAGQALLTVVNDILDFSRIESGLIEIEQHPFSPGALLDNAVSIVRSISDGKGLALTLVLDPRLPEVVVGDEDRLRQVLLNLLNNAVKFTPQGGVTLTAEVVGQGPGTCRLRVSVADTGIGIPPDRLDRLFQRFSQVDSSIRREFGGTGLGLAISKRLVELMGGTIGVESRPGQGSTFWLSLEVRVVEERRRGDRRKGAAPRAVAAGARLLLAEDNEINQEIARTVLEGAGHRVDVVADGAAALMAVEAGGYDLVLMDVQMPVMDGMTATARIRALEGEQRQIPIIAMTANVLPQQVAAFQAAGMDDHVGKPFRREELLSAVERWRGRASAADKREAGVAA